MRLFRSRPGRRRKPRVSSYTGWSCLPAPLTPSFRRAPERTSR